MADSEELEPGRPSSVANVARVEAPRSGSILRAGSSRPGTRASGAQELDHAPPASSGAGSSKPGTAADRPSSVVLIDQPASAMGRRASSHTAPAGEGSDANPSSRPGSVLLIDEGRKSRPRTVTYRDKDESRVYDNRDDDLDVEEEVKARLQREMRAISAKHSAGKELVHQEHEPASLQETARAGTASSRGKPGSARESRSRGRSQQKSRGMPGAIGIKWKEAYRAVVAPTSADTGYRHVLTVQTMVPGGAAEASGRIKLGDKLVAVQDSGQRSRKVVIGMQKEEIRRALHGEAGAAISLELLRATDMGAKKAFSVSLVRTPQIKNEATRLPQIGKLRTPNTPSIKQTGWAKGVRLRADMAPADGNIKEYHSLSEEEGEASASVKAAVENATSNALAPEAKGADADVDLAEEQEELKQLKRLKISDNLTRKEEEQLEVMKKHKEQLEEEARKHEERQAHLRAAIQDCESELNQARELFCDVARRATGEILDPPKCTHQNHGAVHSLQTCMQEFRPIIDAFLTKIEEAPKVLPPAIAEGRAQEEQEQQYNKEAARKLRDAKAALQDAEERQERRIAEMAQELEAQRNLYEEEKMAIKESTDEEIAALLVKIELRDKEIAALKEQCEDLRDELDSIVELKDVEEIKLRLLEAELEGGDSDENQLKKVEVLKLACRASALNQDALQEALKDAAVRAQIEVLKKREGELEAEVDKLRASEDQLHEDEKLHRKFCWSVMINVSKVDPDDVKKEEKRQKGGGVEADEIVGAVRDYVEAAPDDAEIFVRNLQDYVHVRFPFLALTDEHKRIISDTFEDLFKEVPPPTEEELKELERLRLEDEAVDYGYTGKEATGRTAGQLRKMISDARVVARDAKVADRQRREKSWEDNSEDEKEPVDSDDSDAVYKSDNPEENEEEVAGEEEEEGEDEEEDD